MFRFLSFSGSDRPDPSISASRRPDSAQADTVSCKMLVIDQIICLRKAFHQKPCGIFRLPHAIHTTVRSKHSSASRFRFLRLSEAERSPFLLVFCAEFTSRSDQRFFCLFRQLQDCQRLLLRRRICLIPVFRIMSEFLLFPYINTFFLTLSRDQSGCSQSASLLPRVKADIRNPLRCWTQVKTYFVCIFLPDSHKIEYKRKKPQCQPVFYFG